MFSCSLSTWQVTISLIIVCLYMIYRYLTRNKDYFAKRNVAFVKPDFLLGNITPVFFRKKSVSRHICDMYNELEGHSLGGMYQFASPLYFVRDPELVKRITVKDFEHFVDLATFIPDDTEPLFSKGLQALRGQKWKNMRSTLSPAFTSSKMKMIFVLVSEIGEQLTTHLKEELNKQQSSTEQEQASDPPEVLAMEIKDLFTKYTNDVIATTAFGIQCNTLQDPENEFYVMGKEFMRFKLSRLIIFMGYVFFPRVMKSLGFTLVEKKITQFFRTLVSDSIKMREKEGIVRPDMIHLLMKVRDEEMFQEDKTEASVTDPKTTAIPDVNKLSLDMDDIAAQALVFFSAGFEVVATLLSFSSMMMAVHQDIQQQVREEIDNVLREHDGQVTYEAVQSMKMLDNFISETLRMYPSAPMTSRKCVKEYRVPDTNILIEKDSRIAIPVVAFHYDPKFFPEPDVFRPERFSDENKHNIQPFTFMPFGTGPRHCIANRFALMETKTALVHILKSFEIVTTSKTKLPIQLVKNFQLTIDGGFQAGFKLRTDI